MVKDIDKKKGELEGEEDEAFVRWKCRGLNILTKQTKFSRREIRMLYQGFKQECPSGIVTEDAFKSIFAQYFPQGDSSKYAHFVFKTFSSTTGQKGRLNFEQFIIMLSNLSRGDLMDKIRWIFNLYDIEGNGFITKDEMVAIVQSIYDLMGDRTFPLISNCSASVHVDKLFSLMDSNKDGIITFDEFCQWCQKDEQRAKNLLMFDTCFM